MTILKLDYYACPSMVNSLKQLPYEAAPMSYPSTTMPLINHPSKESEKPVLAPLWKQLHIATQGHEHV